MGTMTKEKWMQASTILMHLEASKMTKKNIKCSTYCITAQLLYIYLTILIENVLSEAVFNMNFQCTL
jgi:hypothetical protein